MAHLCTVRVHLFAHLGLNGELSAPESDVETATAGLIEYAQALD
jgi:hypothetical protein